MMKKGCAWLFAVVSLYLLLSLPVAAAEKSPEDYLSDFAGSLPSDVSGVGAAIRDGKLDEISDMGSLCAFLFDTLESELVSLKDVFSTVLGILVLGGISAAIKPKGRQGEVVELGSTVVFALILYRILYANIRRVGAYLDDLTLLANLSAPVMGVLQAAGGNVAGAAASESGFAYFLILLENLCRSVLLPLVNVSFGFVAVGALSDGKANFSIVKSVRNLYATVLGFFCMLLTASLGMQSSLSAAQDSMAFRGVRYAVGSFIPFVGGTVSASLQTVAASVSLLKKSLGVGCALAVLFLVLPLFIELFLLRTLLSLSSGVAEMAGASRVSKLFAEMRSVYDMMIALTLLPSILLLFIVTLCVRTACAVG